MKLPALVKTGPEAPTARAAVGNVSSGGLLLERLDVAIDSEDHLWIEIPKDDDRGRVGILGRVAWAAEGRAGVAIEAMLPHHRHRFSVLLKAARARA